MSLQNKMREFLIHHYIDIPTSIIYIILSFCVFLLLLIQLRVKSKFRRLSYSAIITASSYYVFVIIVTVICRVNFPKPSVNLLPYWDSVSLLVEHPYYVIEEIFINVFLFSPIGLILGCISGFKVKHVLLLGFCLSLIIELSQYIFLKGVCEANDLVHNTIGCLLGYLLSAKFINYVRNKN